jgi:hypothetical protein
MAANASCTRRADSSMHGKTRLPLLGAEHTQASSDWPPEEIGTGSVVEAGPVVCACEGKPHNLERPRGH